MTATDTTLLAPPNTIIFGEVPTSWGTFHAVITERGLAALAFPGERATLPPAFDRSGLTVIQDDAALQPLAEQLEEYLAGRRTSFDLPLDLRGTPFQRAVWQELLRIPYGETRSYGDVAAAIGRPTAVRAVGGANHVNPVPVIVPCHRVVGRDGTLTGYGGGLDLKERLLRLEASA